MTSDLNALNFLKSFIDWVFDPSSYSISMIQCSICYILIAQQMVLVMPNKIVCMLLKHTRLIISRWEIQLGRCCVWLCDLNSSYHLSGLWVFIYKWRGSGKMSLKISSILYWIKPQVVTKKIIQSHSWLPSYWANSYCIIPVALQFSRSGRSSNLDTFLQGLYHFSDSLKNKIHLGFKPWVWEI